MSETIRKDPADVPTAAGQLKELEKPMVSNPLLARLIEEVRNEEPEAIQAYNRTHNRHNRSR